MSIKTSDQGIPSIDVINFEIGGAISALREKYSAPDDLDSVQREPWLRENLSPADYSEFISLRNQLITNNNGLIITLIRRNTFESSARVEFEDVHQTVLVALTERAWDFNPAAGKFSTFATAIIRKGTQNALDTFGEFGTRTARENIQEARRLSYTLKGGSPEARSEISNVKSFRNSPKMVNEWTVTANSWSGRVELDKELSVGGGDTMLMSEVISSPTARAYGDDDALTEMLSKYLDDVDVVILILSLGLDGNAPMGVTAEMLAHADAVYPDFPTMTLAATRKRHAAALAVLAAQGSDVTSVLTENM